MSDKPPQRATFDAADLAWEPAVIAPKPGDHVAITNSEGDVLATGVLNEDGIIEFGTPEPVEIEPRDLPFAAKLLLSEHAGRKDGTIPGDQQDTDLGVRAIDLLKHYIQAETIRMAEVADLLAGVRSKNAYQMSEGEIAKFREVERILVRISGAFAVPEMFARTLVFKKEV